jgi:hypothetical protein
LILSSLPPERIKSNPHHNINTIDNTPANNTKSDIAKRIKSQNAIASPNTEEFVAACNVSIIIIIYIISLKLLN